MHGIERNSLLPRRSIRLSAPVSSAGLIALSILLGPQVKLRAQGSPPAPIPATSLGAVGPQLLVNGGFEVDADLDGVPDGWDRQQGNVSWRLENGNRYLRLQSAEPGKTVLFYRQMALPVGTAALEFHWKQRVTGLKVGVNSWFDARIMLEFRDAAGQKVGGGPPAPNAATDTAGWEERTLSLLVPSGARRLECMPALLEVASGILDLDDLSLRPLDPGPLLAQREKDEAEARYFAVPSETPRPERWSPELRVAGNKMVDPTGHQVILRGVSIPSLEWTPLGERVLRSTLVAIEDWNCNVIRLPLRNEYWTDTKNGAAYRELVDQVVNLASNRGAYVLLDLHHYRAPRQAHVPFWKDVATRYKNHPAVLFELFNEPHSISWQVWRDGGFVPDKDAPADEDAFLSAQDKAADMRGFQAVGMQALIDAVRGTGARNIVVVGGLDWAYDTWGFVNGYAPNDKGGNGIAVASHIYAWKKDWRGKVLPAADKYPLIISEFGATNQKFGFIPAADQEDASIWVPRILAFIQANQFSYTGASFHISADPRMFSQWDYQPNPEWGAQIKRALAGELFLAPEGMR